ncbi:MAG TPA: PH domain-containing protein [Acidimicrobiales bacterium]
MPFPRSLLNDEEEVVLELHPHWWFLAGPVLAVAAGLVLVIVTVALDWPGWATTGAWILTGVAVLWFLVRYADWSTTHFVLTTDRLIYRHGIVAKRGIEIPLDKVNTVFSNQSILERMLGAGDLAIESASEGGRQTFTDIRRPGLVQNEIYRQIEANENRKFDRIGRGQGGAAGGGGAASIPEQLGQLDELRRRGVITEAEFAEKKADLLRRM